ncbi:hypothetical protein ACIQ7Q_11765 [Streptomyces sp. NPDC096176]|uniref:hypothetical protein n=1 Tax=Streptomyces sp. NPDC096176 TaxID=3366079 RepID=UPI0037F808E6
MFIEPPKAPEHASSMYLRLIAEVQVTAEGVIISVTDPEPDRLPRNSGTALDSAEGESGRGLAMLDCSARTSRSTSP